MRNNDKYKKILAVIAIIKFSILMFILIIIFNTRNNGINYAYLMQSNSVLIVILLLLLLIYLIWSFIYLKVRFFKKLKNILIIEDVLFIVILSLLIFFSGTYQSQYKYLFLFSVITTTIARGKKQGLVIAYISSAIILSTDLIFAYHLIVNTYLENDLLLSVTFIGIAWILGEYVTSENNQRKVLEMELQVLKLKEDAKLTNKLLEETKEHNKFVTEFFSNISHELKTPLNVIFSSLQLITMYNQSCEEELIEKRKKCLYVMKQNCYRLIRLINNLLDITKLDSGFITAHMANGDIVYLVENITMSIVSLAEDKGIEIIFDTDVEEKLMAYDGDKIERIMLNLLSNALKFTDRGGKIYVNMTDKDDKLEISVRDTGVGIPDDKKQLIFGRFMQVDKTLKRNNEGTGIGLSLVKSFVELQEGKIILKSQPNHGSEFVVILPVKLIEEVACTSEIKNDMIERVSIELSDIYID
ncbi:MAG TPA: HAMP domain-containing sensor histidine kinase [Clostridium sp.]|uniref:sensor histidine kinase n=1 Tax=Clostridium sp. TaxID=1506 RepID=UPI002F9512DA